MVKTMFVVHMPYRTALPELLAVEVKQTAKTLRATQRHAAFDYRVELRPSQVHETPAAAWAAFRKLQEENKSRAIDSLQLAEKYLTAIPAEFQEAQ